MRVGAKHSHEVPAALGKKAHGRTMLRYAHAGVAQGNACIGASESYFRLLQASGHEKDKEDIAISPAEYCSDCAIFGIDFESRERSSVLGD